MYKLDKEEQDILNKFESGKLKKSKNSKTEIKEAKEAARNTITKTKHISIRLHEKDI